MPPRLEREDRTRTSPPPFATAPLRSQISESRAERTGTTPQQLFTAAPAERCAPCAGLNPESLMKLQLATAGDVAVPPQIGRGRSSFGPSARMPARR